ncbi:adenylate/guanylate cyclase domain-containing protein [Ruegeria meonggei]|uniref:adenylate/guanylate cyclase domain-containing protein n=1 Tax=Ruegeria meonggei TaxID=1446476 RepID=UPI00366AB17F
MKRRLTAILAIDAVGYSRLMGRNEVGTLAALKRHRLELIDPKAFQYNGHTIKLMGDGALMEFASAVDAVRFAVEVQCAMSDRNADVPEDERIDFRIGINVGDVIDEDGDIHGDGVNVAARLEGLATSGGVSVHQNVRNQVRDKLDLDFEDQGEVDAKNIERPIPVFHVVLNEKAANLTTSIVSPPQSLRTRAKRMVVPVFLALLIFTGILWWQLNGLEFEPLEAAEMKQPLPEKPSIAVLAFSDLSQGANKDYLSDAISEEIISKLSRFSEFFVIARNSSFYYNGKAMDVREIAKELGVRYILEGSQQKSGDQLRVTAQLIDATAGNAIWVETYDRNMADIFALQDEITRTIVAALEQSINLAEYDRLLRQPTESLQAYELIYLSRAERLKFTPEGHAEALSLAENALVFDPGYSAAYFSMAWVHINCFRWGWCADRPREDALKQAFAMAEKAVELDPESSLAHWVLASAKMQSGDLEQAEVEYNRAIALNPNSAGVLADSTEVLVYLGRVDEALGRIKSAIRLNPHHPDWYLWTLAWAQYFSGEYEEGLASIDQMTRMPNLARRTQAALYVRLGRIEDAQAVIDELLKNEPDHTLDDLRHSLKGKFRDSSVGERFVEDLRKAGLRDRKSE